MNSQAIEQDVKADGGLFPHETVVFVSYGQPAKTLKV